jgi:hypothetical protein
MLGRWLREPIMDTLAYLVERCASVAGNLRARRLLRSCGAVSGVVRLRMPVVIYHPNV